MTLALVRSPAVPVSSGAPVLLGRYLRRAIVTAASLCLLAFGWVQFGPVQLGGSTSYVVTDGVSMLPHFRGGGLVVTKQQDSYQVGDVVTYHNEELHAVVMHRIVARDGDRFVFKGDNNDFSDHYHPTSSELIGKEWIYWPGVGGYLTFLRQPVVFAGALGLLAFFSATSRSRVSKAGRRRRHHG